MKKIKNLISRLHFIFIFMLMLILLASSAYSFWRFSGIDGKCDTNGVSAYCYEVWYFNAAGNGLICVTEEDGGSPDDSCCVGYIRGAVLDKGGRLSNIQSSGCSTGDDYPDNGQGVLDAPFSGSWGFGRDVLIDYDGTMVLCDQVGHYTDSQGDRWRCDGTDFDLITS